MQTGNQDLIILPIFINDFTITHIKTLGMTSTSYMYMRRTCIILMLIQDSP